MPVDLVPIEGALFGVEANVGGVAFTLNDPVLGRLDSGNVLGPIDPGGWVSITCDVSEASWAVGASRDDGVFTRCEAGVAGLVMLNVDGRYDPADPAAPYYGRLEVTTPVRLWAGTGDGSDARPVFTGTVESVATTGYLEVPVALFTLVDGIAGVLNAYDPATVDPPGAGIGESASARVGRLLDDAGWTAPRDIPPGGPAMGGLIYEGSAWTELLDTAEAARWQVFLDGDGTFRAAPFPFDDLDPIPEVTWGSCPAVGVAQVVNVELQNDTMLLRNMVDAHRVPDGATVYTEVDAASVARYGRHREDFALPLNSDADVQAWAAWVAANASVPTPRLRVMAIRAGLDTTGYTWQALLDARLGDVWRVLIPELRIDRTAWVRGWAHTVTAVPDGHTWETVAITSTASLAQVAGGYFTLDSATLGRLNAGNVLRP